MESGSHPHQQHLPFPTSPFQESAVYLLIRFDSSLYYSYNNAIKQQKMMMATSFGGYEVAICPEMHCTLDDTPNRNLFKQPTPSSGNSPSAGSCARGRAKFGLGILYFPSEARALSWLTSAPKINQQDWLFGVDMVLVPARAAFLAHVRYVELVDWYTIRDKEAFYHEYLEKYVPDSDPAYLNEGYNVIAAPNYVMKRIRGVWTAPYLIVNLWPSIEESVNASFVHNSQAVASVQYTVANCEAFFGERAMM